MLKLIQELNKAINELFTEVKLREPPSNVRGENGHNSHGVLRAMSVERMEQECEQHGGYGQPLSGQK
jgi:hypothetical protein